jgi:1-acyl-sn-glycerol-3-phosphate acyltransferase
VIHLRSSVFLLSAAVLTLAMALFGLPTLAMHRNATYRMAIAWARGISWLLRVVCGLKERVVGRERVPPGPVIFALKHQSAWETVAFLHIAPPFAGVLKRELLRIPIYGWYLRRLGMVPIDRAAGGSALKSMLRQARAEIAAGRCIMIMPEGTRMPPGKTGRYHPGVAALYAMLGLTVVPVALNAGLFWGRRSLSIRPGTLTLEFLEPIAPGEEREAFMARLRDRIESASERLRHEAGDPPD